MLYMHLSIPNSLFNNQEAPVVLEYNTAELLSQHNLSGLSIPYNMQPSDKIS